MARASPIQSGESTHHHDQSMYPVNLRPMNRTVRRPVKPTPPPLLLLVLLLMCVTSSHSISPRACHQDPKRYELQPPSSPNSPSGVTPSSSSRARSSALTS